MGNTAAARTAATTNSQTVCIDLPGEKVKCVVYKPKLQIVLRKHRDVIFELSLNSGASYTVEADQSDFYNARDKKLVEFAKKQKVSFRDGEKLHLWVSREFKGRLILKANGQVLGHYEPSRLDATRYDADPATKPSPLLVVMKKQSSQMGPAAPAANTCPSPSRPAWQAPLTSPITANRLWALTPLQTFENSYPLSASNSDSKKFPTVVVVDAKKDGLPEKVAAYFAGGGKSVIADLDPDDVVTRNWIYGQIAGTAAYARDNWSWLKHSIERKPNSEFKLIKAKIHYVRGKIRIYFSGYSRSNPVFKQGGYGSSNAKVVQIFAGVGSAGGMIRSTAGAVAGTLKGNAAISFIFGALTSFAEWKADAKKDGYDLTASLLTALLKALLVALIVAVLVAIILAVWMVIVGAALAALAVAGITIVASIAVGYVVDSLDKKAGKAVKQGNTDGMAGVIAPWLREAGTWIGDQWEYLQSKFAQNYGASR